ncbi:beta strand repeat-containing protein [Halocalculus aciditolerans]|uniref:Cell surface protein n=1 Tax=Halocalculus aciditolerans TaxID=1383812 RepID=A0A830F085_9EURY|nr:hypothetical protein [Halocalculus aciditolerans]GGL50009.1 cell surface protein [Halocalculus aciditolerans]
MTARSNGSALRAKVPAVAAALLVVVSVVAGVVYFSGTVFGVGLAVQTGEPSVQSGEEATLVARNVDAGNNVTFAVNSDGDSKVETVVGTATAGDDGVATLRFTPTEYNITREGWYNFSATTTTSSWWGGSTTSRAINRSELDDTAPAVTLTGSETPDQHAGLTVTAADDVTNYERLDRLNVTLEGPRRVVLTNDDFTANSSLAWNETTYAVNASVPVDGNYTVSLTNATDGAGNAVPERTLPATRVTVDTHAPNLSSPAPTGYANATTPTIVVGATDDTLHVEESSIAVTLTQANATYLNASSTAHAGVSYNGTHVTVDPAKAGFDLAQGPASVTVTANDTDAPANHANRTWGFIVDSVAPEVTDASASDTGNENGIVADGDVVSLEATVTDAHLDAVTVDASAFGAGTVALERVNDTDTFAANVTVDDAPGLADGDRTLTVVAADAADNHMPVDAGTLTLDTSAPAISDVSPANNTFVNGNTTDVTATVTEANTLDSLHVTVEDSDGTLVDGDRSAKRVSFENGQLDVAIGGNDTRPLAEGPVTITMTGEDGEGNERTRRTQFIVDTVKPVFHTVSVEETGTQNGIVAPGTDVSIIANVSDRHLGTVRANMTGFGTGWVRLGSTANTTLGRTVAVRRDAVPGNHTVVLTAGDDAGNSYTFPVDTLAVDVTPPTYGEGSPSGVVSDSQPTVSVPLNATGSPLDAENVTVTVTNDGGAVFAGTVGNTTAATYENDTLAVNLSAADATLVDGQTTVLVQASDVDGNAATKTFAFAVDDTPPALSNVTVTPVDGDRAVTSGDRVRVEAEATDPHFDAVSADLTALGAGVQRLDRGVNDTYESTVTVGVDRAVDRSLTVPVTAVDTANNTATADTDALRLDTVPPEQPTVGALGNVTADAADAYAVPVSNVAGTTVTATLTAGNESVSAQKTAGSDTDATTVRVNASALPDGTVGVDVTASDAAGNAAPDTTPGATVVAKDTARPAVESANTAAGDETVFVSTSEALAAADAAAFAWTGDGSVTSVDARHDGLYALTLDRAVSESSIKNPNATVALTEAATDPVGTHAAANASGEPLHAGATALAGVDATVDSTRVTVTFNGPVAASDGGALTADDFTYTDAHANGSTAITSVKHAADGATATLTLDAPVAPGDLGNDTLGYDADAVVNTAGRSLPAATRAVADTDGVQVDTLDATTDYGTVTVAFESDEPLDRVEATVAAAYGNESATLTAGDFTVTESDGAYRYSADYRVPADNDYAVSLRHAVDYGGHDAGGASATATVDAHAPAIASAEITDVSAGGANTTVAVEFTEPVNAGGLGAGDVTVSDANVTSVTATRLDGGNATDRVDVTVAGSLDTSQSPVVSLSDGSVTEAAGDGTASSDAAAPVYATVRDLHEGRNYVSIPAESGHVDLADVDLSGVQSVWTYDHGMWQSFDPRAENNTLDRLEGGNGYVFVAEENRSIGFAVENTVPERAESNVTLDEGWNLVGHYQEDRQSVGVALDSVENVTRVRTASGQSMLAADGADDFRAGHAYWVYVSDGTQTYEPASGNATAAGGDA